MSKDVKKMVAEIGGALDGYPREQLQAILAYVFKEYVVESGSSATGALSMLDARSELEGLSFAELITWLQQHLELPELALFEVSGGRVQLRVGGRLVPLEAARAPEPLPVRPQPAEPAPQTQAAVAVTRPPVEPAPPMPPAPRSPPTLRSQPQPMPPPIASTPSHQAPPAAPPNQPLSDKPGESAGDKKDESSPANRFSWLEVD